MTSRHQAPPPPPFDSPACSLPSPEDVPGPLPRFPYASSSAAFAPQLGRRFAKAPHTGWKSQWEQQEQEGQSSTTAHYSHSHSENPAVRHAEPRGQAQAPSFQQAQHHAMHGSVYSDGAPAQAGGHTRDSQAGGAAVALEMSDMGTAAGAREAPGNSFSFSSGASPAGPAGERELESQPLLAGLSLPQAQSGTPHDGSGSPSRQGNNSGGSSREPPGGDFPGVGPGHTLLPSKHRSRGAAAQSGGTTWHHPVSALHTWRVAVSQWWAQMTAGIDLSADIVAIAMVYFVQGVLGLARLAINFFLKDELGLDPDETAILAGLSTLPWLVKPLYGFLSDGVPLFGYHRRSYLVLCGILGAFAWAILALFVHDKYSTVACILLSSLSVAVSDVVVDSMVVERARGESQATAGALQSLCWGSSAFGGIVSAYSSGALVETYGTRFVFGVTALLPLITSVAGFFIKEKRVQSKNRRGPKGGLLPSLRTSLASNRLDHKQGTHRPSPLNPSYHPSTQQPGDASESQGLLMPGAHQDSSEVGSRSETELVDLRQREGASEGAHAGIQKGGEEWAGGEGLRGRDRESDAEGSGGGGGGRGTPGVSGVPSAWSAPATPYSTPSAQQQQRMLRTHPQARPHSALPSPTGCGDASGPTAAPGPQETSSSCHVATSGGGPSLRRVSSHNSSLAEDSAPPTGEGRWCSSHPGKGPLGWGQGDKMDGREEGGGREGGAGEVRLDLSPGLLPGERCAEGVPGTERWAGGEAGGGGGGGGRGGRRDGGGGGVVGGAQGGEQSVMGQLAYLWDALTEPGILMPTLFIFLWQAAPKSETAMFFYTTNQLGFGPEFLGRVRLVTSVASLLGVGIYNFYLKETPLRTLFFWSNLLGMALGATQLLLVTGANRALGISDHYFALGDSLVLTVLGQVSFMPVLVLAARLCPPGIEATLFATLMSISNGANVVGGLLGATLTRVLGVTSTNFINLALLLIICNFSAALCLPFLRLLPKEEDINRAVAQMQTKIDSRKDA